jgi:hypothetical protein
MSKLYCSISVAAVAALAGSGVAAGTALAGGAAGLAAATTPHLLTCAGKQLTRPAGDVVIACGDANFAIDDTKWSTWTASAAQGTTALQLNLCNPNCASSKMTTFRNSGVKLFDVKHTAKYGAVFTKITVSYTLHGKRTTFTGYPFS